MTDNMVEVKFFGALSKDICNGWFDGIELVCKRGADIEDLIKQRPDAFAVGLATVGIGVYVLRAIYKGIKAEVHTMATERKIKKFKEEQHDQHIETTCT